MWACMRSATLPLVQLMIAKAKLDSRKRRLQAIADCDDYTVLHWAAASPPFSSSSSTSTCGATSSYNGNTPLQLVLYYNRSDPIISLLVATTAALAPRDFAAPAFRVHGDERTLRCLALSPSSLAVRAELLLCIKCGYVNLDPQPQPTRAFVVDLVFDTRLASFTLNDNIWSHIVTFLRRKALHLADTCWLLFFALHHDNIDQPLLHLLAASAVFSNAMTAAVFSPPLLCCLNILTPCLSNVQRRLAKPARHKMPGLSVGIRSFSQSEHVPLMKSYSTTRDRTLPPPVRRLGFQSHRRSPAPAAAALRCASFSLK